MKREHYIPFDKEFLLEQQLVEYAEDEKEVEDFKKLFDILEHYAQSYRKTKNKGKYPDAIFVLTDGYGNQINPEFPKRWLRCHLWLAC